ncbi:MAG: MlaD family protein [Bacteroidota bacterium]
MKTPAIILSIALSLFFLACARHKKNKLTIVFDRVDNLQAGSPVKIQGIDIGKVLGLNLIDGGVLVKITLWDNKQIPAGSIFSIVNPMIGSAAYIDIEPSESAVFLSSEDTASGKYGERGLLDNLISDSAKRKKIEEALDKIAEGLKELVNARKDSTREFK